MRLPNEFSGWPARANLAKYVVIVASATPMAAHAIGDGPTSLGALLLLGALALVALAAAVAVVYAGLRISGKGRRMVWLLVGALPGLLIAFLDFWLIAIVFALGSAFLLGHISAAKR